MRNTLVILNPVSGNGAGKKTWPAIENALRRGGLDFDLVRTTGPRTAIALAEKSKLDGYETLIAIGGDGTVNQVADGLIRAADGNATGTLAVIPVGSGNDFAKMLGIKPDWQEGVKRILARETRVIDVGRVIADNPAPGYDSNNHYFVNALNTGFGAHVVQHIHEIPLLQGFPMYLAGVFKTLLNYSVPRVKIKLDEHLVEQRSTMIAVANGRCIGGGFWIAPTAANDDGLLDVIIAAGLGRAGILSLLPKVVKGTHIGDPRIKFARAARVTIDSPDPLTVEADGEIPYIGAHHLEIELLPKRLTVVG